MSSLLSSQGMVLATAMAVSGTVILLLCRQKPPFSATQFELGKNSTTPSRNLRSCISSQEKRRAKKKKRVHFAEDVVHQFRRENEEIEKEDCDCVVSESEHVWVSDQRNIARMPANRMALYNGIRQDRLQRMACSY